MFYICKHCGKKYIVEKECLNQDFICEKCHNPIMFQYFKSLNIANGKYDNIYSDDTYVSKSWKKNANFLNHMAFILFAVGTIILLLGFICCIVNSTEAGFIVVIGIFILIVSAIMFYLHLLSLTVREILLQLNRLANSHKN
jgi:hypothetical protein